jgi:hypothetical protein
MAHLHVISDPTLNLTKSADEIMVLISNIKIPFKAAVALIFNKHVQETIDLETPVIATPAEREELRRVLDRAAADSNFITRLTFEGSKALQEYDLSLEEKAAILNGDIGWIEVQVGKLNDRLKTWLCCRLQQEIW